MTTAPPSDPLTDEEWAARTARLAAARKQAEEDRPTKCPACGSKNIVPTFLERDEFECGDWRCCAIWIVQCKMH